MKITTTIFTLLFPFIILSQECEFFPIDTLNVCGYEYDLPQAIEEGTLSHVCDDDHYLSLNYAQVETNIAFSSCGIYELIYNAADGSCADTLLIQVSDPNFTEITKNIDISLGYGDIDCPGNATASCYVNEVSIFIGTGTPTPIWSFCSTTICQTSVYSPSTLGNVNGCIADSIVIDTISVFSSSDYCDDTDQFAFIVLDSEGDTVTDNTFLEYLSQLQDSSDVDCPFPGQECSFTNTSTCHDSIVIDTTLLPIPVRIGGQWTLPMIEGLQLFDTTYFTYFGRDYELILDPGVNFYGPGELDVSLSEVTITTSNDTIREYPNGFYLSLQWEEDWILDTILVIKEKYFDTDDDCFSCGGVSFGGGFNVPGIPDFPCGPVGIYYPSICECEYIEPNYSYQVIQCDPKEWLFELISPDHFISYVAGATSDISGNTAILTSPTNQNIQIESVDYNGCSYYSAVYLDEFVHNFNINGGGLLSCEVPSVTLNASGQLYFSGGTPDLSNTIWEGYGTGSSITVYNEGYYSASYTDNDGCVYSASTYVGFDDTIDCNDVNPLANTECDIPDDEIICDITIFDSFNYVMPTQNNNQPGIFCEGDGALHNVSWFSFVAYSGDYSINIVPSNCSGATNGVEGIQVGISSDCYFTNSAFCAGECTLGKVSVPSGNLVEGQVYRMFIDGCSGSVCNYQMEILGNPELPSLAPQSITTSTNENTVYNASQSAMQTLCIGTEVTSKIEGVDITGEYLWSIKSIEGEPYSGITPTVREDNEINLTINNKGIYEVCINEIRNGCEEFTWTGQMCFTVKTTKTDDENFGLQLICEGESENFDLSILDEFDPNEDGIYGLQGSPWNLQEGNITVPAYDSYGCVYEQIFELEHLPESDVPTIRIVDCQSSLPFEVGGTLLTDLSFASNNEISFSEAGLLTNINGCDSTVQYIVEILKFSEGIETTSSCNAEGIGINLAEHYINLSSDETITIDVINPNGQFIATDLNQEEFTISHGSMDGIYTLLLSKTKGNTTCQTSSEITLLFSEMEPEASQITGSPLTLCADQGTVIYTAINADPNVDFVWSVDENTSNFNISGDHQENISIDWNNSGGNLSVIAVNECGLEKETIHTVIVHEAPELVLINNEEVCQNSTTNIILDVEEDMIDTYSWDFDGANIMSGNGLGPYLVMWESAGAKEISLTTTDINGCEQNIETEIIIFDTPVAEFSASSDSVCVSEALVLNLPNAIEGLDQNWDFDDGINEGVNNPILRFDTPGWKTLTLSTDNGKCSSELASMQVFVEAKMEEVVISCMDQNLHSLLFEWNAVIGANGYLVALGNQPAIEVTDNSILFEQLEENTEYNVEISVISDHRCPSPVASSSCATKECIPLVFEFDIPDLMCIEDEMNRVDLVSTVLGVDEGFTWTGVNVIGSSFDPNGLVEGIYTFEITHQQDECISSESIDIELIAPPTFEMSYDKTLCFGEESTTIELFTGNESHFIFIDGEISESVTDISPGSHEIIIMDADMCASNATIFIEQSEEYTLTIFGNLEIKEGDEHTYTIDESLITDLDYNSIIWTINGSEYCNGPECLSINIYLEEDSDIEVSAFNMEGCVMNTKLRVTVDELEPKLVIPNIFSPNNDGLNDFWFAVPNKDDIKIERIMILDRWNNLIYSQNNANSNAEMQWDGKFNGAELQPGVYVYAIKYSADNNVETVYGDVTIVK